MPLTLESWAAQEARWPISGRHILAQYDEHEIVVYQAYRPSIAKWAVEHGRFGGPEFGYGRMSWVKPNFLWMMYRSGWAGKEGQEHVLAVRIRRELFDRILAAAVPSGWVRELYDTREAWQADVERSEVRLQWDPDHDPDGRPCERRAIQLGLRGSMLRQYGESCTIEDVTPLVQEQRGRPRTELLTPSERVYPVGDPETRRRLGLSAA
jgi:hypothetical protein